MNSLITTAAPGDGRILPVLSELPAGCMPFVVRDAGSEPLLRMGDCVAIDPDDCEPEIGAIFLRKVGYHRSESRLSLWEIIGTGRQDRTWWAAPVRRSRTPESAVRNGQPVGWADGPFPLDYIRKSFWGRVTGILTSNTVEVTAIPHRHPSDYEVVAL